VARRLLAVALIVAGAACVAIHGIPVPLTVGLHTATAAPDGAYGYRASLPLWLRIGILEAPPDSLEGNHSELVLLEDGAPLGPAHTLHQRIAQGGRGAYSHWLTTIVFSASDNSDVRTNGRAYRFRTTVRLDQRHHTLAWWLIGLSLAAALISVIAFGFLDRARRWSMALLLAAVGATLLSSYAGGVALMALLALAGVCGVVGLVWAAAGVLPGRIRAGVEARIGSVALFLTSVGIGFVTIEAGLRHLENAPIALPSWLTAVPARPVSEEQPYRDLMAGGEEVLLSLPAPVRERLAGRRTVLTMPDDWKLRETTIPGARRAYYWHGALHVYDENFFRRSSPLPPRDPAKFRVVVIGDSLSYGAGVEDAWTYPRILEHKLNQTRPAEVINLGILGHQSEDIARVLETFYDQLQPDLVIYGICHNDFLDAGEGQADGGGVVLPKFFTQGLKSASVLESGINAAGRSLGLMPDFFDQVFARIDSYEPRFARDLRRINDFVRQRSGRVVAAMVLDQVPAVDGRGQQLTRIAEEAARRAGMDVVDTDAYYRKYHGQYLVVSAWEGHPNEWAHAIFAEHLHAHLIDSRCCGLEHTSVKHEGTD
jgi:lysophospholipase L1-like esterase